MSEKETKKSMIAPISEDEVVNVWKDILEEAIHIADSQTPLQKFLYDGVFKPCAVMFLVRTSKYKKDKKWLNQFFYDIERGIGSTCQVNELIKRLEVDNVQSKVIINEKISFHSKN